MPDNRKVRLWALRIFIILAVLISLYHLVSYAVLSIICIFYCGIKLGDIIWDDFRLGLPQTLINNKSKKAVVITGCDSGFGHALAIKLDSLGLKVYACCLDPKGNGAKELQDNCSKDLHIVPMNVTKDEDVATAVQYVSSTLGGYKLWALINNAGITEVSIVEWAPMDSFQRVFDVNTFGPVRVTRAFLPLLREAGESRIVFTVSLAGRVTLPGSVSYGMSKHALVSFADGLRCELKQWNISVHTIEPTFYKTGIIAENLLHSQVQQFWSRCSADIQKVYGETSCEKYKKYCSRVTARGRNNINEVVNDMIHAILGESPLIRYIPATTVRIRTRLYLSLPVEYRDAVLIRSLNGDSE